MKNYKAYLIDLDGTMYRGVEVIPEAIIFIENLKRAGLPYLFVTNNSTKTPGQVAEHLTDMGIQAVSDDVFTTSQATVQFMMEQKREKTVYVIGERGIKQELTDNGFEITSSNPAFVVVGLDREVDYEKFSKALLQFAVERCLFRRMAMRQFRQSAVCFREMVRSHQSFP